MTETFFQRAYRTTEQGEVKDLYDDWAARYDDDLIENGYETPGRCAAALAAFLTPYDAPIFDFACGTGLSGAALASLGFTTIDGVDLSQPMLDIAAKRRVYRSLTKVEPDADPAVTPGEYGAISAMGALSPGAAPASYLDRLVACLGKGGLMVVSYNDATLAEPDYTDRLAVLLTSRTVRQVFHEYGTHIEKLGSKSSVYVLEKL